MINLTALQMEQLSTFSDCMVMHTQVQIIFDDFDELRLNRHFHADPQCMLLTGDTGVGKSHLINHYKKKVLATQSYSRECMPILISKISNGLDATLIQILFDLELFGSSQRKKRGFNTDLKRKLVNSLIKARVELLIINEFQELIEFKSTQERQLIANSLKFISEEARVPIVLVGMPWAEKISEEPQWASRLVRRRKLEYFSLQNGREYYQRYLMGLARYMPFDKAPKLQGKHTAVALFAATLGENRALKHLLLESLKIALINNEFLENKHLSEAYDKIYQPLISRKTGSKDDSKNQSEAEPEAEPEVDKNPFEQSIEEIVISEIIGPSRYNPNPMEMEHALVERVYSTPKTLSQLLSK